MSIVGTNDHHGHIEWLPLLAGHVNNLRALRAGDDGAVLLVDGGDMFQGTLVSNLGEGAAVIRGYNALEYSAATVGNHEFDFGPVGPANIPQRGADDPRGALIARATEADFPLLSANLLDRETNRPVRWDPIAPRAELVVAGDITVGVIGVTSVDTLVTTLAGNVADLQVAPLAETIEREARELRNAGAEVVVVAAHAGGSCERFDDPGDLSSCRPQEIFRVAEALSAGAVDVIVGGHTHRGMAHVVNDIAVIESFAYGVAFGRVDLTFDRASRRVVARTIYPPYFVCNGRGLPPEDCQPPPYAGRPVVPDPEVAALVAEEFRAVEALQVEPIGVTLNDDFYPASSRESALGNLIADLIREARSGDVGIVNGGGLRAPLRRGTPTYGEFFEMFPFDNRFAVAEVSGAELRALVAEDVQFGGEIYSFGGLEIDARCAGNRLEIGLRTNGRTVQDADTLRLVLSDFLATGSSPLLGIVRSAGRIEIEDGELMRDALVGLLRARGGSLEPLEFFDPSRPRYRYTQRPLRCR
ncbi:MAG: 5'-nucleotidase C-terminal domain-containing protein [Myxococcota bacterium]